MKIRRGLAGAVVNSVHLAGPGTLDDITNDLRQLFISIFAYDVVIGMLLGMVLMAIIIRTGGIRC